MTEPVTLAQIKANLRLGAGIADFDDDLSGKITAARRACELRINRSVVGADLLVEMDAFPSHAPFSDEVLAPQHLDIELPGGTVMAVTSVTYLDETGVSQILDPATYIVALDETPARVASIGGWPKAGSYPDAVRVAYAVSPLDPDDLACVVQAMKLLIANWFRNSEAVQVDARGVPAEIPLGVTWLLEPVKQWATS
jgi:uncharacterized phiE125 gp8 family phage protein